MAIRTESISIEGLVDDLRPIEPMTRTAGLSRVGGALILAVGIVALFIGFRADLLALTPDPMLVLTSGPFLLLACAAGAAAVRMSLPHLGNTPIGWPWAAAMTALLPAGALLDWGDALVSDSRIDVDAMGWACTAMGLLLGLFMAVTLTLWLRRGAPTSPERAGLLVGIASGSAGMFAYSLHCPHTDISHIGLWHSLAVVLSAAAGRWIVPAWVRW